MEEIGRGFIKALVLNFLEESAENCNIWALRLHQPARSRSVHGMVITHKEKLYFKDKDTDIGKIKL
jgi:hypothetical protein